MSTERLNQSSEEIKASRKAMLENEELGVSILQDRHQQHQSLYVLNKGCLVVEMLGEELEMENELSSLYTKLSNMTHFFLE